MRVDGNAGSTIGYEPNSFGEWQEQPEYKEPPLELSGAAAAWNFPMDDLMSLNRMVFYENAGTRLGSKRRH